MSGSSRLLGRLCLAGSPQTHMAVDLKDETNDGILESGITNVDLLSLESDVMVNLEKQLPRLD